MMRWIPILIVALGVTCMACDSNTDGGGEPDTTPPPADTVPDIAPDIAAPADTATADATLDAAVDADVPPAWPPRKLPIEYTRPAKGTPIPDAEITQFSKDVMGLMKDIDWGRWLLRNSTGVDASSGQEDYLAWYNDVHATKADGVVTFKQTGGDHNMWIPGSKVLSQAINGCTLTGDWATCKLAEQYCKGLTASVKGFVWGDDDPAPDLMARAIFPNDNTATLDAETWQDDGRTKVMEFHEAYKDEVGWNAQTFAWPENPTWGDIWITNMRSKDDVCAIVRTTLFLHYVVEDAPYDWVKSACGETLETMQGFNKDIVDSGYNIRTKDPEGNAYIIEDQDLGSYVWYLTFGEDNECSHRLASDFIAYQEPRTGDCGTGYGTVFELFAVDTHYYNYPIVWNYHMAALGHALLFGFNDVALALMDGLTERMDIYLAPNTKEPGAEHEKWGRDMAILLVQQAAVGFPLTADEARLVQTHWRNALEEFQTFEKWDLWDASVPDGDYPRGGGYQPAESPAAVDIEAYAMFLEYCNSPFKNPAGAQFIDCDVVADPSQWGN